MEKRPTDPLTVTCPFCNRPPGAICADPRGNGRWGNPHIARKKLARKDDK